MTKYTKAQIKDSVNRVVKFIEKNKKLPATVRVNQDTLKWADWKKLVEIKDAEQRLKQWIKLNNAYPKYVTTIDIQVPESIYKKIWTDLPKPTPKPKEFGWLSGGQETSYWCGPFSLRECIYNLTGTNIPQKTLAGWAGTTSAGSSHANLELALKKVNSKYNLNLKMNWYNFSDIGSWSKLKQENDKVNKAVFMHIGYYNGGNCAGGGPFGHYESVRSIDVNKNTITVNNSLGDKSGSGYKGFVQTRSLSCQKKMMNQIGQKSICIVSK